MNGHAEKSTRVPPAGVWAPAVTFFDPVTDELDLQSQAKYYKYLSQYLTGLVILGTNAETFLLTRDERAELLKTARQAVGPDYPIMAGVSGHSTKQVLEFINDAHQAGSDYALVLPCAYFGKQTTPKVIMNFYSQIATASPLPIVIYNFPGVCNGIDIDSDTMTTLAKNHNNIVGTKLTCASVGKITRLAATFPETQFATYGGQSDFLIGGLSVGSAGCIAAFANIFPKTISHIYTLYKAGKHEEALKLHRLAADTESFSKAGIASTKFAVGLTSARFAGIEGAEAKLAPRRPYEGLSAEVKEGIRGVMAGLMEVEEGL
ncbi:aldolase [Teratosphaeria nubilosa]|uniref:Aldolase n=1 Tax=Teratosphaeria nubilosa TaxID=161662 RepID=A0A6G1LBG8_9PEZI|nr:aldolase [Teratosphaeria nubilosa]